MTEREGLIRAMARGAYERMHAMPPWNSLAEDEIAPLLHQSEGALVWLEAFNGGCRVVPTVLTNPMIAALAFDDWDVVLAASPYAPQQKDG